MNESYSKRLERAAEIISRAERVAIGGGAGLSAAAGLNYSGVRFTENIADFIKKYGLKDMYSATFYPYSAQEEKWAYFSRHVLINRILPPALPPYKALLSLVHGKEYFVITTNVDGQFYKAGFERERIFAVQGDYAEIQCARACHNKVYGAEDQFKLMAETQRDCKIPLSLVPKCPVCGGNMEVHIRKDEFFIEDDAWHAAYNRYSRFISDAQDKKTAFIEAGVGYNTPSVIKYPFERFTYLNPNARLIRINTGEPQTPPEISERTVLFTEDAKEVIKDIGAAL